MARMAAQWAARFDARQWPLTWPVWLHSGRRGLMLGSGRLQPYMARMAAQWAARFDARQWPLTWPVWLHSGRQGLMLGSLHGPYGCTVGGEVRC